ncbi:MAG: altronate dehydratase family protein [Rhodospirillales bacterium]
MVGSNLTNLSTSKPYLSLHPDDDVVIALVDLDVGLVVEEVSLQAAVPNGHKLAVRPVAKGAPVRKFGQVIGFATMDIAPGDHVHSHNLETDLQNLEYEFGTDRKKIDMVPEADRRTFDGIMRANGVIATRNYIGVITSVNCAVTVARLISDRFRGPALDAFPNVDGVVAVTHGSGCGMSSEGESMDVLRRTLAGYINHANFAGVLIVGLGCEANQISTLLEVEGIEVGDQVRTLVMQEEGGTAAAVEAGVEIVNDMLGEANDFSRISLPISHLKLGLQCGGSDGFSAITANPALGVAVDLLVQQGGTGILSETSEIYGAEHLLLRRAESEKVGRDFLELLEWWKDYTARNNTAMDNNPSPGNKAGGLTTIFEKSLGAAAKGGSTDLRAVYKYAEPITEPGFVFMDSPGYDPVSATGQVASGANVICFTTGRGSCFGCKPVPSLKLATNSDMYHRMTGDMDINCGRILDGEIDVQQMGAEIFEDIIACASGAPSKSELLGYGEAEIVPWNMGAVL